MKSVLWRVGKRLFYIEDARCLKVNYVGTFNRLFRRIVRHLIETEYSGKEAEEQAGFRAGR